MAWRMQKQRQETDLMEHVCPHVQVTSWLDGAAQHFTAIIEVVTVRSVSSTCPLYENVCVSL